METKNCLGVWMDHSEAHLIESSDVPVDTRKILSEFTAEKKHHTLSKSENIMHNTEQQLHAKYYGQITDALKDYKEIVLFGPTTAKDELLNLLKADRHFDKVKIKVEHADKMTDNQQHAFVTKHFQRVI